MVDGNKIIKDNNSNKANKTDKNICLSSKS